MRLFMRQPFYDELFEFYGKQHVLTPKTSLDPPPPQMVLLRFTFLVNELNLLIIINKFGVQFLKQFWWALRLCSGSQVRLKPRCLGSLIYHWFMNSAEIKVLLIFNIKIINLRTQRPPFNKNYPLDLFKIVVLLLWRFSFRRRNTYSSSLYS